MSGRRTQRGPGVVSALRRLEDPAESADPRIRSLVASLSELDYAPAPEPDFRAELRAQLVAVAPRIVAESRETAEAATSDAREGTQAPVADLERRRRRFAHPLGIAAGVAAAFVMLFGGALWLSQKSLPGDSLYGLKRAGENIRLDLASSGTDRGHLYLSLAQTRVEEARALVQHSEALAGGGTLAGGRLSPGTASLVSSTLNSADADLADGSTELNRQAVTSHSDSPLAIMKSWAPGQLTRLHDLLVALPAGPLQSRTASSWQLTSSALARARTLAPKIDCSCLQHAASDKLGPVPCTSCTAPSAPSPKTGTSAVPTHVVPTPARSTAGTSGSGSTGGRHAATTHAPRVTIPTAPAGSSPAGGLPKLPIPLPTKPPLTINSCGISVALGPLGVGVGSCPTTP